MFYTSGVHTMLESAVGTAMAIILFMTYFSLKTIAKYAIPIEIALFLILFYLFEGTFSGAMTGILAGLIVTAFLRIYRAMHGYQALRVTKTDDEVIPRLRWIDVPPTTRRWRLR